MSPDEPTPRTGRYAALDTGEGVLAIYDTENPEAWITSDVTVADVLESRRSTSDRG